MAVPQPVFVIATYGPDGKPDAMCAAWGGITYDDQLSICVDDSHLTADNLAHCDAFTVSMATGALCCGVRLSGIVSARDEPTSSPKASAR